MTHLSLIDQTARLAVEGYAWLPNLRRRAGTDAVGTRLLGRPVVGLCGPEAARFFYDERHLRRHGALPEVVRGTLFGKGAVHTLDGGAHLRRKAMFTGLMTPTGVDRLAGHVADAWDAVVAGWPGRAEITLFDEVAEAICAGVCRWTGVPLTAPANRAMTADLVAMVDGFATLGPRHWRARRARGRAQARLGALVESVRRGDATAPPGSALAAVVEHRDVDGEPLDRELAAVELINVIRPTVAVGWFVTFAAHALHRWPRHRAALADGDPGFATAFGHEVRRFYPFVPFVGGLAVGDLTFHGVPIPAGAMVLLDVYGQDHDPDLWPDPYAFRPDRFVGRAIGEFDLIPQGGGDPRTGHRCPGEAITMAVLTLLATRLARLDHRVPDQDLRIPLHRMPTRVRSGLRLTVNGSGPMS